MGRVSDSTGSTLTAACATMLPASRTWYTPGCYPGEPVFVGRPGRTQEDDGVLLSVVLDTAVRTSFLLVLDAASMGELARAVVPQPILFGYHGEFFA